MDKENFHIFDGKIVKILTCSDCNIKCKHCYISFKGNFEEQMLMEIVEQLSNNFEVRINGTEPLLHREYLESLKKANQKMILTNGLVFKNNHDYIDELKQYGIDTLGISYHFDFHDDVSVVSKNYLENLFDEIIKRGMDVQIMTTITSKNYDKVLEYCDFCIQRGIKKIRFTNFILQGNATNLEKTLILNDEERHKFFKYIDIARDIYPENVLRIQRCGTFGKNYNSSKEFYCGGGFESIVLTPDLKAYPCLFLSKPGNEIGFYEDGKIYVSNSFNEEQSECNAMLKLNKIRRKK